MAKTLPTQLSICKNLERLVHQVESFLSAQQLVLFSQGFPVENFPNLFLMDPAAPSRQLKTKNTSNTFSPSRSKQLGGPCYLLCLDEPTKLGVWRLLWCHPKWHLEIPSRFPRSFFLFSHMEGAVFDPQISECKQKTSESTLVYQQISKKSLTMLLLSGKNRAKHRPFPKRLGDQV